jgi:hypothetical protein
VARVPLSQRPAKELADVGIRVSRWQAHSEVGQVETNERLKKLFLSNKLSDYEGLRSRLLSWAPTVKVTSWRRSYWDYTRDFSEVLACLCVFGGPLYLMYTPNRAVILPLGLILSLATLGMILYVRNSPAIPTRTKKGLWILLLSPILVMLFRLFSQ